MHHSPSRKFSSVLFETFAATRETANIHLVFLPSKNKKSPTAAYDPEIPPATTLSAMTITGIFFF